MSEYLFASLLSYYLFFFCDKGVFMDKILRKIVNFFSITGIIASSTWWILKVLELLTEWFEDGTLLRVWNFIAKTFLFCTCLFLMWILHSLTMFAIDKLFSKHKDKGREINEAHKHAQ